MEIIIAGIVAGMLGVGIGYYVRKTQAKNLANSVEAQAEKRMAEAKVKEQEIILGAQEKSIKLLEEVKKEEENRRRESQQVQSRLTEKETLFDKRMQDFEDRKTRLEEKVVEIQTIKEKIDNKYKEIDQKLEVVSGLSRDQAKSELMVKVEAEAQEDLLHRRLKFDADSHEELKEKARDIVVGNMQRTACNHAAETTSTAVQLPSEEMKGRIIGKEGRNIKTIEKMTGCELIIDETPEMILVSSFSPIRRRVCQLAIEKLISDGRIQPAKIEEYVEEAKRDLAIDIKKAGDEAALKMGLVGLDPKLVSIVGRLKYRTSYGQNVLNHCLEVGYLSGLMAEELGMNPGLARKAGFFHDVGKAIDHETQGAHTQIGYTILKKFNVDEDTAQVALTHHDTNPPLLLTKLVMAGDAISASRVGARRDTYEQYVTRLEDLEKTAREFPGIEKVYAIQAGREIRVFVNPSEIDDYQSYNLAKDIARRIESELQYPGEIKVMVIRESRVIEYAR